MACSKISAIVESLPRRPRSCTLFKCYTPINFKPIDGVHYDSVTKRVWSSVCQHMGDCREDQEILYLFLSATAHGHISDDTWKTLFPEYSLFPEVERVQHCCGFRVVTGPRKKTDMNHVQPMVEYAPDTCLPYVEACKHWACQADARWRYALIAATTLKLIPFEDEAIDLYSYFVIHPWTTALNRASNITEFLQSSEEWPSRPESYLMWNLSSLNWHEDEILRNNEMVDILIDSMLTPPSQKRKSIDSKKGGKDLKQMMACKRLKEGVHSDVEKDGRLKVWKQKLGNGLSMVNMKRYAPTSGRDMFLNFVCETEVPSLIRTLVRFWIEAGLDFEALAYAVGSIHDMVVGYGRKLGYDESEESE
ncbi:unnamed protein product [Orchesella dallaii]|uniref:Uncharacterized protein n=1 Tax=Orchesella dallaii TaxID=48710 RepID=A0ABP1QT40_9HEXA